jgi:CBS domain containing-hemolysin-like protein
MWLIFPLVWLFEKFILFIHRITGIEGDPTVTESELISMVYHGEKEGTIESGERKIIERVFGLNDLHVEDVMTPRHQVFTLNGKAQVGEVLFDVVNSRYSRIPLYMEKPNEIEKVVHLRDLLHSIAKNEMTTCLYDIAYDPVFSPLNQPLDDLITILRKKKKHLAVVVDEYGSSQGVVTLEDLVEELVGEIYDESDEAREDNIVHLSEKKIVVDGDVELRVIEEFFSIDLSGKPTDAVSWWILQHIERIPQRDEKFILENLEVFVQEASSSHIEQVIISIPSDLSS